MTTTLIRRDAVRSVETYNLLFEQLMPRTVQRNDGGVYEMPFESCASDAVMDARLLIKNILRQAASHLVPVSDIWDNVPAMAAIVSSGADRYTPRVAQLVSAGLKECAAGLPWELAIGEVVQAGTCDDCDGHYYLSTERKQAWCSCKSFDLAKVL